MCDYKKLIAKTKILDFKERKADAFLSLNEVRLYARKREAAFGKDSHATYQDSDELSVLVHMKKGETVKMHYHDFDEKIIVVTGKVQVAGREVTDEILVPAYKFHQIVAVKDSIFASRCIRKRVLSVEDIVSKSQLNSI